MDQSEISKRRAQPQQLPPADTSPPIAGIPSKRLAEAEHHLETKKQKTEDSTTSRASSGESSNIEIVHMSQPERISKGNGPDKDKSGHDETEEEQAMKPLLALLSRKKDERKALIENLQGKKKALQEMKKEHECKCASSAFQICVNTNGALLAQIEGNRRLKSQLISSREENEELKAEIQRARTSLSLFQQAHQAYQAHQAAQRRTLA